MTAIRVPQEINAQGSESRGDDLKYDSHSLTDLERLNFSFKYKPCSAETDKSVD